MNLGEDLGSGAVVVVALQQKLSGFLVEGRFGVRIDQQTLDGEKDVFQTLKEKLQILTNMRNVDRSLSNFARHIKFN